MPNIGMPWDYAHVITDVIVHTGQCVLHAVVINRCDTGVTSATVYDGVDNTGDVIAIIDVDNGKTHYVPPVTLLYDVQCETGIFVEFSQQNAEADLTVTHK